MPRLPRPGPQLPGHRVSEEHLARLGIFEMDPRRAVRPWSSVIASDNPDSHYKRRARQVQETPTGSLTFGRGRQLGRGADRAASSSTSATSTSSRPPTSFEDFLSGRAFRGAGQEFRAETVPGTQVQRYTVSFREPFLFDSPYSLKRRAPTITPATYNEYDETPFGDARGRRPAARPLLEPASVGCASRTWASTTCKFFEPWRFPEGGGRQLARRPAGRRHVRHRATPTCGQRRARGWT